MTSSIQNIKKASLTVEFDLLSVRIFNGWIVLQKVNKRYYLQTEATYLLDEVALNESYSEGGFTYCNSELMMTDERTKGYLQILTNELKFVSNNNNFLLFLIELKQLKHSTKKFWMKMHTYTTSTNNYNFVFSHSTLLLFFLILL